MVGRMYLKPYRLVRLEKPKVRQLSRFLGKHSQLNWEFRSQKAEKLDSSAIVVVIAGQTKILQKVISERVGHIAAIKLRLLTFELNFQHTSTHLQPKHH